MYGTYCRLNVHVWASDLTVLRALNRKLKPFTQERREQRKQIFRLILKEHHDAQELCREFRL